MAQKQPAKKTSSRPGGPPGMPARWLALLAVAAIAVYACWLMLQPFLDVVVWSVVLVMVFYPVHEELRARLGYPKLSALLSCTLVVLLILLPLVLITMAVVNELTTMGQNLQAIMAESLDPAAPEVRSVLHSLDPYVDVDQLYSPEFLAETVKDLRGTIATHTLGFVGGIATTVVHLFFVIITMYYLFRDGDRLLVWLGSVLPLNQEQRQKVLTRTREVINASVFGVLVIAVIQGSLGGLAFWVLGLPSPVVWGVVMTLLSTLPFVGAFIVWIPAAIYLALSGDWGKALLLTAWGSLVIGMIDNLLRPWLVGCRARLHELFVLFSVLGGLYVFGLIGLILGPVLVAITFALLDIIRQEDHPSQKVRKDPDRIERTALPTNLSEVPECK